MSQQSIGKLQMFLTGMTVIQALKMQYQRRGHGSVPIVALTHQTVVTLKKKDFLSNKANKQSFPSLLSSYLEEAGCVTDKLC